MEESILDKKEKSFNYMSCHYGNIPVIFDGKEDE